MVIKQLYFLKKKIVLKKMDKNSSYSTPLMYKKKIKSRNTLLPGTIYYSIDYWWPGALVTLTLLFSYWQTAVVCLPGRLVSTLLWLRVAFTSVSTTIPMKLPQAIWLQGIFNSPCAIQKDNDI